MKTVYGDALRFYRAEVLPRGEKQWAHKLTESNVVEIRRLIGVMPQLAIARMFNIHPTTVSDIKTGRRWGWLK